MDGGSPGHVGRLLTRYYGESILLSVKEIVY